ncbi:hypothetical protein [Paenibacillus flagellatus]|uniref:Uncharacterized protein n=1 Tax=Paenibacillus flagellatus TaxID=2211139 RepID=A0A2V5KCY2_9BACL|nr:hypothetical protein [Paenibacillus flagellatus]PYI57418.1 hypothetical protein DLM86_02980 [Paenibacillus flagellatus]
MKPLKLARKGIVIGGLAAAVLLGGSLSGIGGTVYASETSVVSQVDYKAVVERNLTYIVGHVASLAGRDDSSVRESLARGDDLVKVSGMTSRELLEKLVESMNQSIDFAARGDKSVTAEELNRIKSEAASQISTIITTSGYDDLKRNATKPDYAKIVSNNLSTLVVSVSAYADRSESAIRDSLRQGKTLVEASGLNREELYNKLIGSLNQSIDFAARNDKLTTSEELAKIKSEAADKISTIISTSGYDDTSLRFPKPDYAKVVERGLATLVGQVASIADRTDDSVRESLRQGRSLAEISGLKREELMNRLVETMNQGIDFSARNDKSTTPEELSKIKSEAASKISTIISTSGYDDIAHNTPEVDYEKVVERDLSFIVSHVASLADRKDSDILDALASGQTLVQASGMNRQELLDKLVASMNQSIDFAARNDKKTTKEELSRIKSDAASRISTILSTSGYKK